MNNECTKFLFLWKKEEENITKYPKLSVWKSMIHTEPPYFFMPWTWPQLDSNFRRKQISGHYSKVRHISKPISSCFFVTDVGQNLQETADGAIPEIIPIHFNYAQFSTQPATSNHSKFEGCCTPTKFLMRFIKSFKMFLCISCA